MTNELVENIQNDLKLLLNYIEEFQTLVKKKTQFTPSSGTKCKKQNYKRKHFLLPKKQTRSTKPF
jgi:hypothetical protein